MHCCRVARCEICADALLDGHGGLVIPDSAMRGPCLNGISLGMLSALSGRTRQPWPADAPG